MQRLDDVPGRDVVGAAVHDLELLVALVVSRFRVIVAVDDLDRPLGILELHFFLRVALVGNGLLAFPLAGRHAIMAQLLLLLLMELFCKLLDLLALLSVMVPGVVHRALLPALIAIGGLVQSLVTMWAMAPNSRCSDSSNNESSCQQLVVIGFLVVVVVLAAALSSGIYLRLVGLPCLRSRLEVPCMPLCSPGALVH
jgi:hypothetical protein